MWYVLWMPQKYIFITGGVLSSLGKGIASASIALLLEEMGFRVAMMKLDPYLNVDPGTMNPFQHGEVYVTDDGAETDLDLGHYHRFTSSPLSKLSNATSGQLYEKVIRKERKGDYLGETVQVVPHITNEIKDRILACGKQEKNIDVLLVEVGGTVGDIESGPFMEAIRQFRYDKPDDCVNIHLTYVPYIEHAGEVKTKPTQHSVQLLQRCGIFPDMILCRSKEPLSTEIKDKISLFCNVPKKSVIDLIDVKNSIYEVPLYLERRGLDESIAKLLNLDWKKPDTSNWQKMCRKLVACTDKVKIGVVGKYLQHQDAYKSIFEALLHGAIENDVKLEIKCIESDKLESLEMAEKELEDCAGVLIPGGFGARGFEGKILATQVCREKQIPYFGICLGMQVMCVEFARNILKLNASSTEMDPETPEKIISLLSEQERIEGLGGTMRLGAMPCHLDKRSKSFEAYQSTEISERHRHRYEFNNQYKQACEDAGLKIVGSYEKHNLCEIVENESHPWMVGVQFHPEFKSKPDAPHPLFKHFIKAAKNAKKTVSQH